MTTKTVGKTIKWEGYGTGGGCMALMGTWLAESGEQVSADFFYITDDNAQIPEPNEPCFLGRYDWDGQEIHLDGRADNRSGPDYVDLGREYPNTAAAKAAAREWATHESVATVSHNPHVTDRMFVVVYRGKVTYLNSLETLEEWAWNTVKICRCEEPVTDMAKAASDLQTLLRDLGDG